jgi:large subunit ribosomal protein L15
MTRLNEVRDNPGAAKKLMRVGRGVGSGKGKTGGRGVKGQKSRRGVSINGFEGGQMPIHMRAPKRGFNKLNRARYAEVNLGRLQKAIDAGRLDAKKDVDEAALVAAGLVRRVRDGVRLLAQGQITSKVKVIVTGASAAAVAAVEKAGGSVTVKQPAAEAAA